MSEENVEIVRKAFAAFERGDMEALLRLADEDIVITQSDVPGIPAQQHGHRGVLEAFAVWPELWACRPRSRSAYPVPRRSRSGSCSCFLRRRTKPSKPPGCRSREILRGRCRRRT